MPIPLRQGSLIGVISYTDSSTSKKCEINVRETFWRKNVYPTVQDMFTYLNKQGYIHVDNPKWTSIM